MGAARLQGIERNSPEVNSDVGVPRRDYTLAVILGRANSSAVDGHGA
jgi:hypothetical protein